MTPEQYSNTYKQINDMFLEFSTDTKNIDFNYKDICQDFPWQLSRINKIIKNIKSTKKPIQILEVGIGHGIVTTGLYCCFKGKKVQLNAIEHPNRIYLNSKKYRSHLEKTGVSLKCFDIVNDKWSYNQNSFDYIIFSETLEHIPPTKVPFILKEISRILKPGGSLICTSPNLGYWRVRWKMLRGKSPFDPALPLDWAPGTYGHIRLYNVDEMKILCEHEKLHIVFSENCNFGIENKKGSIPFIKRVIYKMLPSLSSEFIFVAQKIE